MRRSEDVLLGDDGATADMNAKEAQRGLMLELTRHSTTAAHNAWPNEPRLCQGGTDAQTE